MGLSPICRWLVELVDDSGSVVIRLLQDMTEPVNTILSNGVEDGWLAGPPAELFIGHKIEPMHALDSPESHGHKE